MKKRIVCFGDSNTWGYNAVNAQRYSEDIRWTGRLQKLLGEEYQIIEEGQNGRTIIPDDPWEGEKSGYKYIVPCLGTHDPFDLLVLMLGTNDTKERFSLIAEDIARGMGQLLEKVIGFSGFHLSGGKPKILLVSPIEIGEEIEEKMFGGMFGGRRGREKTLKIAGYYEELAKQYGCFYLNAAAYAKPSAEDCVHLDEAGHKQLADGLAEKIREILK